MKLSKKIYYFVVKWYCIILLCCLGHYIQWKWCAIICSVYLVKMMCHFIFYFAVLVIVFSIISMLYVKTNKLVSMLRMLSSYVQISENLCEQWHWWKLFAEQLCELCETVNLNDNLCWQNDLNPCLNDTDNIISAENFGKNMGILGLEPRTSGVVHQLMYH